MDEKGKRGDFVGEELCYTYVKGERPLDIGGAVQFNLCYSCLTVGQLFTDIPSSISCLVRLRSFSFQFLSFSSILSLIWLIIESRNRINREELKRIYRFNPARLLHTFPPFFEKLSRSKWSRLELKEKKKKNDLSVFPSLAARWNDASNKMSPQYSRPRIKYSPRILRSDKNCTVLRRLQGRGGVVLNRGKFSREIYASSLPFANRYPKCLIPYNPSLTIQLYRCTLVTLWTIVFQCPTELRSRTV